MTYTITPLIAEDAICARVRELAASIDRAMAGKPYILLLLLNGALPFAAMLEKHLKSRPAVKAVKEAAPLHYTPGSSGKCIHRYRNPYFKRRRRDREPDIGFYS